MVDSRTNTLVAYTVAQREHGYECNCEAAAHHRTCWHLTSVLEVVAPKQAPKRKLTLESLYEVA
jgi:hypothetical protein